MLITIAIGCAYLNRKFIVLTATLLIVIISVSVFIGVNILSKPTSTAIRPFYVGVEFAYSDQFGALKALVDKVKDYTNLFIIGSIGISFNRSALDQSCNYLNDSGLNFIVFFTSFTSPNYNSSGGWSDNYTTFTWMRDAYSKYGNKFLGVYRYDEPGGNQLDNGTSRLVQNGASYTEVATNYEGILSGIVQYYYNAGNLSRIVTSDYGLYWFDYKSSYSTVFAEFLGNETRHGSPGRPLIVSLDRGAAQSFHKNWGIIVTWQFNQAPYLESGDQLYSDLTLAYSTGASYAIVFSYPVYPDNNPYGTLLEEHFQALQKFWNVLHNNPDSIPQYKATVAYVLPQDYGFGFRSSNDNIWGLFPADNLTQKISADIHFLLEKYNGSLNVIYNDPTIIDSTLSNYQKVYYWNETIT